MAQSIPRVTIPQRIFLVLAFFLMRTVANPHDGNGQCVQSPHAVGEP